MALASASVLKAPAGWHRSKARDMSKFKPAHLKISKRTSAELELRKLIAKMHPSQHKTQSLPKTKSFKEVCGIQGNTIAPHIVGGSEANPHQFPWQVGIFMDDSYFCGGSIISDEYILTAGHCADGFSKFDIVIGAHAIRDPSEEGHLETVALDAFVHPQYDAANIKNDVAIMKVSPITFNEFASPICLPERADVGETLVGEVMTISGWGRESDEASSIAELLNYVRSPIISQQDCEDVYGPLGEGIVCIDTTDGKGTCNGDSGGPMILDFHTSKVYNQYGIVSFGSIFGCEVGYPAGFTRVTEYLDYISDTTGIIIS